MSTRQVTVSMLFFSAAGPRSWSGGDLLPFRVDPAL